MNYSGDGMQLWKSILQHWRNPIICTILVMMISLSGCYAPFHTNLGTPASQLSETFRMPARTNQSKLNLGSLVASQPSEYLLGPGDQLEITIPNLVANAPFHAIRVKVQDSGKIQIPGLGTVIVRDQSLTTAQENINLILSKGILVNPKASITLIEKGTVNVLVLGEVESPGIHALPRFENDIAHALAAANGFTEESGDYIEVHRKSPTFMEAQPKDDSTIKFGHSIEYVPTLPVLSEAPEYQGIEGEHCSSCQTINGIPIGPTLKIPLKGGISPLSSEDVILNPGDVIVVPSAVKEVFYVVGNLSVQNRSRFTIGDAEREIGNGFLLPKNRDIDVVTAVVMAGYIDPIESPTTVTVHRTQPDGTPFLIHVDLIKARKDRRETVMVQPGDIIYLNPDMDWWLRRTFDRILDNALGSALGRGFGTGISEWFTN